MSNQRPTGADSGLILHRASRSDALVTGLAGVLATPLSDPFATEIVSVPTPGVERWLSQSLAIHLGATGRRDGVAAGIDFARLDRLLRELVDGVLGLDPATDPWHPERGVWALLRVIDAHLDEPWAGPLRAHLDPSSPGSRRYVTASRVFGLFRAYAAERPELLRAWRSGASTDATGIALGDQHRWQAELWRALRADLGGPDPVERIDRAAQRLIDDPDSSGLPGRLSVFGPTRLPVDQIALLTALAQHRTVHVWLPYPSAVLWERVAAVTGDRGPRVADPTTVVPRHRLNRRLARDARELQLVLSPVATSIDDVDSPPTEGASPTLLQRLQSAVRDDEAQPTRAPVAPQDDSLRIHACHGPDRQVEVLREVVLGLLADHPELEPRDIVVMCPDIETFAPLIAATFALNGLPDGETHPGQNLRVRLADRSLRELNPLLGTLQTLLALGDSRAGMSEVLDLCADPPVARRFGFTDTKLERLRELVPASGVRWGLDRHHRERFSMQRYGQNTWRAGLERMLLGIAMDDHDHHVQGTVLPLAAVESSDAVVIGQATELLDRLGHIVDSFTGSRSLTAWTAACREALELVTEVPATEMWQVNHAWSELSALAESAETDGTDSALLTPGDMRAVLADAFAGRPSRSNFRTGALTLSTMSPMRSVPHRAVILLGLDDGVFPRRGRLDGDDLLAADPWIGDRDRRSEDRQQLLDAVLAAGNHLVVIHSGANPQTGESRPPAVPVAELRSAVEDLCSADPWPVVEIRHPLQPFSPVNFAPRPRQPQPFSFDPVACRAAAALLRSRTNPAPALDPTFATEGLPPLLELEGDHVPVELGDLLKFYAHPARDLLRRRANLSMWERTELPDEIPIEPSGLETWAIGERMLQTILGGANPHAVRAAEFCRGEVPPGRRGQLLLDKIDNDVRQIHRAASTWLAVPPTSQWINAELGRWQVTGLVAGLRDRTLVRVSFSRLSGKQRLQSWIELLALKVAHPHIDWRAVTIGKRGNGCVLGPIAESDARARLNDLIQLWHRGASELVVLPARTAAVQAESQRPGGDPREVTSTWKNDWDAVWGRFGFANRLSSLLAPARQPTDGAPGRSAFEALALHVWNPLLDEEGPL